MFEVCVRCLTVLDENNYKELDSTLLEIIEIIFENLKLDTKLGLKICNDCEKKVKVAFEFKGMCIDTEDKLYPYISGSVGQIDLKTLDGIDKQCNEPNNGYVCRLCLQLVEKGSEHLLQDTLSNNNLKNVFEIYLHDVNLDSVLNPIVCVKCLQALNHFSDFIAATRFIDHVKPECADNLKQMYIKLESIDIVDVKEEQISEALDNESSSFHTISKSKFLKCKYCPKVSLNIQCIRNHMISHSKRWYKCEICSYKTKYEKILEIHIIDHMESALNKHKCSKCAFRAKTKSIVRSHERVHADGPIFKCAHCDFQTKYSHNLKRHSLRHSDNPKTYDCDVCTFQTTDPIYLYTHKKRKHTDLTKAKTFICGVCLYRTIFKTNFRIHLLSHEDITVAEMYTCYHCGLQTKYKRGLIKHIQLLHMKISEEQLYKCKHCELVTKSKCNYKAHMVQKHMDESQVKIHKCSECLYKTRLAHSLKYHMMHVHDKVPVYTCKYCFFETVYLGKMTKHARQTHHDGE